MPFLDHLEELRWRILYSLLAVVVGTLVGWVIVEHVDVIGLLIEPIKPLIPGGKLRVTSATDPYFITLTFAIALVLRPAPPGAGCAPPLGSRCPPRSRRSSWWCPCGFCLR